LIEFPAKRFQNSIVNTSIKDMKRVLTGTFALFYVASNMMAIVEHTASWVSHANAAKSRTVEARSYSPKARQKRILEYPFAISADRTPLALPRSNPETLQLRRPDLADNFPRAASSRAPPFLL
jgi:hypothetical protein